jgi:ribosome biogenesis protein MAK21
MGKKPYTKSNVSRGGYKGKDKNAGTVSGTSTEVSTKSINALVSKLLEGGVIWYNAVKPLKYKDNKKKNTNDDSSALSEDIIQEKKKKAIQLHESEVQRYEAKKNGGKMSSDDKYLATMMKSGTLADRVAALTLTIQSSPFHQLSRLGQLIMMANKKARRESIMAVDSLKDLFINNLLPDDRKLNFFRQNPLTHPDITDEHLVIWYFEHCLKTAFGQLVNVLSNGMNDAVDNHKRACIRAVHTLLSSKPEQEGILLGMIVNKLGDPDRKIAAYIHKLLQELLQAHPMMKKVVTEEVERLLTRSNVSERTKYNAILFLNQIYLDKSPEDAELATHLISVYFGLFTKEIHEAQAQEKKKNSKNKNKKKQIRSNNNSSSSSGIMDRKMLSSLLMGVNRAFPYAKVTAANFQEEIDSLFAVVHKAHFSTSIQALMLLFQVMNSTNSVSDRFYTALYAKLNDPKVRETSKHTLFLNLLYKAIKVDVFPARACAMIKRLLQLSCMMTPPFVCAVLFLLSEIFAVKPHLKTLLDQPEASISTVGAKYMEDEHFEDAKMDVDEAVNSLKDEEDEETTDEGENDLSAEVFIDDGLTEQERQAKVLVQMFGGSTEEEPISKSVTSFEGDKEPTGTITSVEAQIYDPLKRNPLYAKADIACAWEIQSFLNHYHPSVQQFARQLLNGKISYKGDPLVDFTLHAFFEKFMNKKPRHKTIESTGEGNAKKAKCWTFAAINSEEVLQLAEENIEESDRFFYKFFKERATRVIPKKKKKNDDRKGDLFSDEEEDEEMEAFAQQLAEGIMDDGNLDDEDVDMVDWSGPEEDSQDEEEEERGDFDDAIPADELAFACANDDDDIEDEVSEEEGEEFEEYPDDIDGDDEGDDDEEEDDIDDIDGFPLELDGDDDDGDQDDDVVSDFDISEQEQQIFKKKISKGVPQKRKSPFASADDYKEVVRQAQAKKFQKTNKNAKGKHRRA